MRASLTLRLLNNSIDACSDSDELRKGCAIARKLAIDLAGNTGFSDDIEAEALIALAEAAQRFREGRGTTLTTFAYPRMRGRAVRATTREVRRRMVLATDEDATTEVAAKRQIETTVDARNLVAKARRDLTRRQRSVLRQHYFEGKSFAAISRRSGWSHSRTQRIHAQLLDQLRQHAAAPEPKLKSCE